MELEPMKRYREPVYPTRRALNEKPELLRLVPARWQANTAVLTTLATFGLLAMPQWVAADDAGGATPGAPIVLAGGIGPSEVPVFRPIPIDSIPTRMYPTLAPITAHGDGVGTAQGTPADTVFLPEKEARAIIADELTKAGFAVNDDKLELQGIPVPTTFPNGLDLADGDDIGGRLFINRMTPSIHFAPIAWPVTKQPLVLDAVDEQHNIAVEYISREDYEDWFSKDPRIAADNTSRYDIQRAATRLRSGIGESQAKPNTRIGVFYDPCLEPQDVLENMGQDPNGNLGLDQQLVEENAKMMARYELRQQVRDFIGWLKSQNAI